MSLVVQCEQLSDARWAELLPQIQQHQVIRLEDCGLSEARCEDLGRALRANASLAELSLRTNQLGDVGVRLVLQGLQGPACPVQRLSLQNCGLTETGCSVLPGALRSLPALRELSLGDNPLGDRGLRLLCEGLQDPKCNVEKLQLEYCSLTAASCELLAAVLRAKPGFRELVVSNNSVGEDGVRALCRGLLESACLLEKLELEGCGVTRANCKDLCSVVEAKDSLQELYLGENRLGDAGLAELCKGLLSPGCSLKILWLWECDITAEGCKHVCSVLRAKDSLRELSLAGNELGDGGARLLCEALREPGCQLESLWVKDCGLTAACCPHFGTMLEHNRSLQELQVSGNSLGDAGLLPLCRGLSQPGSTLRKLWLGDCDVTDKGCAALASLLLACHSLRDLDLSNNCLGDPGILRLVESLRQPGCRLQQLVLYDIYWTEEAEEHLQALEKARPALRVIS